MATSLLTDRLLHAHQSGELLPPADVPLPDDLTHAYECQDELRRALLAAGAVHRGWKAGLTSAGAQQANGVDHPVAGFLLDHLVGTDLGVVRPSPWPRAEVEVAVELADDLPSDVTRDQAQAAVGGIRLALEIVDSRWQDGPKSAPMLVADNVNHLAVVLGPALDPGIALDGLSASISCAGQTSTGGSAEVFGDPLLSVCWLAAEIGRRGHVMRAGDLVMTGTLCPPVTVEPGASVTAELDGIASWTVSP